MGLSITVTVGPLASGDTDGIGLSQAAAGAQELVLNGLFAQFDADAIAASQSAGGAGNLTLNGVLVSGGVARMGAPRRVYITSAGDDTGVTFTVVGTLFTVNGEVAVAETVTGADTGVVSTSAVFDTVSQVAISGASASTVTVGVHGGNVDGRLGGVSVGATLDHARRVIVTSGGNDSGITFTILGTDHAGNPQSEVLAGASGAAAQSALDYKTVISVRTSGATASTVQVGTNGVASSPPVRFDDFGAHAEVAIQCTVDGTVNYTVQQTMEDPNRVTNNRPPNTHKWDKADITWVNHSDTNLVSATATKQGNYAYPPIMARVLLNSGTGTVTATFRQVG